MEISSAMLSDEQFAIRHGSESNQLRSCSRYAALSSTMGLVLREITTNIE